MSSLKLLVLPDELQFWKCILSDLRIVNKWGKKKLEFLSQKVQKMFLF